MLEYYFRQFSSIQEVKTKCVLLLLLVFLLRTSNLTSFVVFSIFLVGLGCVNLGTTCQACDGSDQSGS